MAELRIACPEVILEHDERRRLVKGLEDCVEAWAASQLARLGAAGPQTCQPNDPGPPADWRLSAEPAPPAIEQSARRESGKAKPKPKRMVFGPFTGLEGPPFDEAQVRAWNQGDVLSAPNSALTPRGMLLVRHFTGFGQQISAYSYAAVMFWAKPSAVGLLQYQLARNWESLRYLHGLTLQGASAVGASVLFTGIQEVALSPFQVGPMSGGQQLEFVGGDFRIGQNDKYDLRDAPSEPVSRIHPGASILAKPPNLYACWMWLTGAVATSGNAGVELDASYTFDGFDVTVP